MKSTRGLFMLLVALIAGGAAVTFSDLTIVSISGSYQQVQIADNGALNLIGVTTGSLDSADFLFA